MFRPTFWAVTVDRAHARTHPESRDLITRLLDVLTVDWQAVGSLSAGAAVLSVLTSLAFPPGETL